MSDNQDQSQETDQLCTWAIGNFLSWCDLEHDIKIMRLLSPEERAALAESQGLGNVPEYAPLPPPALGALISEWLAFQKQLEQDNPSEK